MRFADLVSGLPGLLRLGADADVSSVAIDSRQVSKGALFIALPGEHANGHAFADSAAQQGAVAFAVSESASYEKLAAEGYAVAEFSDTVDACWRLSNRFFREPSNTLRIVGITGTNGKTTTAWLLAQMLRSVGSRTAYIGTLGARFDDERIETSHTTPFPPETFALLRHAVDSGIDTVVMEVSSHALAQRRVDGVEFDVGVFTNLSQDHLDFHQSIEDYFESKARLFTAMPTSKQVAAVVNADDPFGGRLATMLPGVLTFGRSQSANLHLTADSASVDRLKLSFSWEGTTFHAEAPIGARFNVENCLAAVGAMLAMGHAPSVAAQSLREVQPAPGRFESVPTGSSYKVIVDYAHTPDALSKLLQAVREVARGRILTVFGCGGDRDRNKRPKMAAAVTEIADVTYITSDNPRTENPDSIISEIVPGVASNATYRVEPDRRKAIQMAIEEACDSDVVVIAGKGHEDYQIIGKTKVHFDDREIAAEAVREKAPCV